MPEVEFEANGGTASGYLAVPESGKGPGVVVLQEWWGVDDSVKRLVDRFAADGFVALAPDHYHGETTEQPDEAQQKMMAMNMAEAEKEMRGAVDYVASHEAFDGTGVGAVGFCLGGGLAVWAATANPKVDAVVTYYYVMPHGKPDFSKIDAPVLGHFGTNDDFVSVDDAKSLEQELKDAGADARFEFYEGGGHAFANDHNRLGTYNEDHARTAWEGTVDFLKKTFKRSDWLRLVPGPSLEPHRPVLPVVCHEGGAGGRQQRSGQAVVDPLATDPEAATRNVDSDEPITVCPWPGVAHICLT
jgi:carboxymethylenebutenolidase